MKTLIFRIYPDNNPGTLFFTMSRMSDFSHLEDAKFSQTMVCIIGIYSITKSLKKLSSAQEFTAVSY